MKKVLLVLISLLLLLSMSGSVIAAEIGTNPSDIGANGEITTTVKSDEVYVMYKVSSESYTVVIPGTITLDSKGDSVETSVEVTQVTLVLGHYLNISVKSNHNWNLVHHTDSTHPNHDHIIPYSMKYTKYDWNEGVLSSTTGVPTETEDGDSHSASSDVVLLQVTGNSKITKLPLILTMNDDAPSVGDYYDKLTFTVSVES